MKSEIVQLNADFTCTGRCAGCSRYFDCTDPRREEMFHDRYYAMLEERMMGIGCKIAIMSGKGGVGKSMLTANLGVCLAKMGYQVGVVDFDFSGSCIPRLLGVRGEKLIWDWKAGIQPVVNPQGVHVISLGFVLENKEALIWDETMRRDMIKQFLTHVDWGKLDYLIIDLPPGTGAESIATIQYMPNLDGAVVVTIPSVMAQEVARKSITLCRKADIPVLGVVENMSYFICPSCSESHELFEGGGGALIADEMQVDLLGKIPMDPLVSVKSDQGIPFISECNNNHVTKSFAKIVESILTNVSRLHT